jgi:hypothetical protein
MLFIIPSWGDLLGYPTLGKYVNHYVSKIQSDLVWFIAGLEAKINIERPVEMGTEKRSLYFIFGLGYYYSKFELQSGRYITDSRQLTGLILSDFVYDHLASSKNLTLEDDKDVVIAEKVFKLPIDLSIKSVTKKSFIKGALMRNLFIPYKDVVLEMMDTINDPATYQLKSGHALLSTHCDYYNKILISDKMREGLRVKYMEPTAGIHEIIKGSEELMNETFTKADLEIIEKKINQLKEIFSNLEYDPMYLFSIIDNASKILVSSTIHTKGDKEISSVQKTIKEPILISAQNRMNSVHNWPEEFERHTKEELEHSAAYKEIKKHPPTHKPPQKEITINNEELDHTELKMDESEKFEIRTQKRPIVESKPLPTIHKGEVLEILKFLRDCVEANYDLPSIGKIFEKARDNLRKIILQAKFMWEMSKIANLYEREKPNRGLSQKERRELIEKIDSWIQYALENEDEFLKRTHP